MNPRVKQYEDGSVSIEGHDKSPMLLYPGLEPDTFTISAFPGCIYKGDDLVLALAMITGQSRFLNTGEHLIYEYMLIDLEKQGADELTMASARMRAIWQLWTQGKLTQFDLRELGKELPVPLLRELSINVACWPVPAGTLDVPKEEEHAE